MYQRLAIAVATLFLVGACTSHPSSSSSSATDAKSDPDCTKALQKESKGGAGKECGHKGSCHCGKDKAGKE